MKTFQDLLRNLNLFWEKQGCVIHQGYDLEVGAGTMNPATFLRCLGPEPYNAAYVEPSRRPSDGRYGENPNRVQHYFQYQVVLKPSPPDIQTVYLESLKAIGLDLSKHDIRFVHDDWENPTIGAAGLGWEAWIDGMEVTQITYFQVLGSIPVKPVTGEITYGLERLAMYLQNVDNIFDLQYNENFTYGDIYQRNEIEWSHYNFERATTDMWFRHFSDYEKEASQLIEKKLPIPAFDFVAKASHAFNVLDARKAISVTERTGYITRIRNLARMVAAEYIAGREKLGYPYLQKTALLKNLQKKTPPTLTKNDFAKIESIDKRDFLLEIGSEELPASFVGPGLENLKKTFTDFLKQESLSYDKIQTLGTPRRLTILVEGLATTKPASRIEKKGPPTNRAFHENGEPTEVGLGFFNTLGLKPVKLADIRSGKDSLIEIRKVKDVEYIYATVLHEAKSTAQMLIDEVPNLILNLPFPKKMRWADLDETYARPLLWIIALFGDASLPFEVANILSGRHSFGHRQLCPKSFEVSSPATYVQQLKEHKVLVNLEERRQEIDRQLTAIESELKVEAVSRAKVMNEVLQLVEWPLLTYAQFDKNFLKAPKELLTSEMIEHQKYFPLSKSTGELAPYFVITANNTPSDEIRKGNCKVLSARLKDGVFLYEQDLKSTFEQWNEKLKNVTYQKGLGSVFDKVERLTKHVRMLQQWLPICDEKKVERAALLCKSDLVSSVVFEFPELQGTMGKYYAICHGEDADVASAIEEHWMPLGESAPLPETGAGTLLSIAEKLDNLISCFALDLKPTSSSDPYALRRQVLGVIKMLIRGRYHLPIRQVIKSCLNHFRFEKAPNAEQLLKEIEEFIANRIKTVFQDYGFSKDLIEASLSQGVQDIYDMYCRVAALQKFRKNEQQFNQLYEVYKRAKGQINQQAKKHFAKALLNEPAEIELDHTLNGLQEPFEQSIKQHNYDQAYGLIAKLQTPLAKLFDEVKVLADDPKIQDNRIALLQRVFERFEALLDFSKIQL